MSLRRMLFPHVLTPLNFKEYKQREYLAPKISISTDNKVQLRQLLDNLVDAFFILREMSHFVVITVTEAGLKSFSTCI